ncbi:MAG: gephyrin-like molybdotransferase Glp [Pseudomonadota bacterium]
MSDLLPVAEGLARMLAGITPLPAETVDLSQAGGRVLATLLQATRTQPPFAASAMDGYAVRREDLASLPTTLKQIGASAAGHGFHQRVPQGCCVRIFTGAPVPEGADTIIIQENTTAHGETITIHAGETPGRYIRSAGLDFTQGETLLSENTVLDMAALSLAASMNHPTVPVRRQPRVAIIASGDELVLPGSALKQDQIISSNSFGVAHFARTNGAQVLDLGIAADTLADLGAKLKAAETADIIVTMGGASVGEHDLVHQALTAHGVALDFWKMAMRPGKPVMFGRRDGSKGSQVYLGLPGNPVSSLVGTLLFLGPLIQTHLGLSPAIPWRAGRLAIPLPQNDKREEYLRAIARFEGDVWAVTPFDNQDSSILSNMVRANCLIRRAAFAPATKAGASCDFLLL